MHLSKKRKSNLTALKKEKSELVMILLSLCRIKYPLAAVHAGITQRVTKIRRLANFV